MKFHHLLFALVLFFVAKTFLVPPDFDKPVKITSSKPLEDNSQRMQQAGATIGDQDRPMFVAQCLQKPGNLERSEIVAMCVCIDRVGANVFSPLDRLVITLVNNRTPDNEKRLNTAVRKLGLDSNALSAALKAASEKYLSVGLKCSGDPSHEDAGMAPI